MVVRWLHMSSYCYSFDQGKMTWCQKKSQGNLFCQSVATLFKWLKYLFAVLQDHNGLLCTIQHPEMNGNEWRQYQTDHDQNDGGEIFRNERNARLSFFLKELEERTVNFSLWLPFQLLLLDWISFWNLNCQVVWDEVSAVKWQVLSVDDTFPISPCCQWFFQNFLRNVLPEFLFDHWAFCFR